MVVLSQENPEQRDMTEMTALFAFIAVALGDAARRIERLEAHAADMIGTATQRQERLVALQDFDLVRQIVEDVAELSAAAARDGAERRQRLAETLRLQALRDRLLHGDPAGAETASANGSNGGVDLFGEDTAQSGREEVAGQGRSLSPP